MTSKHSVVVGEDSQGLLHSASSPHTQFITSKIVMIGSKTLHRKQMSDVADTTSVCSKASKWSKKPLHLTHLCVSIESVFSSLI